MSRNSHMSKDKCPGRDTMVKAFAGELNLKENEEFFDHIFTCGACRIKFDALKDISKELESQISKIEETSLSPAEEKKLRGYAREKLSRRKGLGLLFSASPLKIAAISTAALLILACFLFLGIPRAKDVLRNRGGISFKLIKPAETVSTAPELFLWSLPEGGDGFIFELVDEDLNTLFSSKDLNLPHKNKVLLSKELRKRLKQGKTYIWTVTAYNDDRQIIAKKSKHFVIE